MKRFVALALVAAVVGACGTAQAAKVWDDMSWWGNTGATPEPVKDSARSGYWWWPKEPASNAGDSELWGNRGIVYSMWEPKKEEPAPPPPPPEKPVAVTRETPVFNNVLFDFDKSVLKAEGKAETDKVVAAMKQFSKDTLVIEGHTCNVGEEAYNMGLGQRRADAVKQYMIDSGIAASRITAQSYGESQPAVANDTPANRKLNRRAMFKVSVVQN